MIEHPHGEDGVKGAQLRQLLNAERQQVGALVVAGEVANGLELAEEQRARIYTDRESAPSPTMRQRW